MSRVEWAAELARIKLRSLLGENFNNRHGTIFEQDGISHFINHACQGIHAPARLGTPSMGMAKCASIQSVGYNDSFNVVSLAKPMDNP